MANDTQTLINLHSTTIELLGITSHITIFFTKDVSMVFPNADPEASPFDKSPFFVVYNSAAEIDLPLSRDLVQIFSELNISIAPALPINSESCISNTKAHSFLSMLAERVETRCVWHGVGDIFAVLVSPIQNPSNGDSLEVLCILDFSNLNEEQPLASVDSRSTTYIPPAYERITQDFVDCLFSKIFTANSIQKCSNLILSTDGVETFSGPICIRRPFKLYIYNPASMTIESFL